jgi:hypothetical protein
MRQHHVAGRQAQAAEHGGRDARRQDDEIAHADPVGQVADEGVEHAGQLGEDGQAAGQGIADAQVSLDQGQQWSQKCRIGVMYQVADADGCHLVGLEAGAGRRYVEGSAVYGQSLVGHTGKFQGQD